MSAKWFALSVSLLMVGCVSSERKEVTRRPPQNFVAAESTAPRTATTPKSAASTVTPSSPAPRPVVSGNQDGSYYPVTQGTMLMLDGNKQLFVPFQEGPLGDELTRQVMGLNEEYFELFGGFKGLLQPEKIIITSNDVYDQKPVYQWIVTDKSRYAVEIPEVARNRYEKEQFKYVALELVSNQAPERKFYFHVDPRNINRPVVVYRPDAKVVRVVMGNSESLNQAINQNLWLNEERKEALPTITVPGELSTKPIQILHLVRLYFSPQGEEFFDPKYESTAKSAGSSGRQDLLLSGRYTGEGIVTGKFEKGNRSDIYGSQGMVQYHFKQEALTVGQGGIKDKPTRMEIEFFTLKLGQDEDQLRLALQQAQFKAQQMLNVFFAQDGKRLQETPDFSFSLQKVDETAKLSVIARKKLTIKQNDGKFTSPRHLSAAILELDLRNGPKIIQ